MNAALTRYRIMAWIVGVMLLFVTAATIVKYTAGEEQFIAIVGPAHGFLYMVYLVTALDLAARCRWSVWKALAVCLAGTIPFLSFVAEHQVTAGVRRDLRANAKRAASAP